MSVRLDPLGDGVVRFVLPAAVDRRATLAALRALDGVRDVALGEEHGAVWFDEAPPPGSAIARALVVGAVPSGREVVLRVVYDGPDLARVAAWAGLPADEVARRHATTYEVRYLGFLPGFAYLGEVDARIAAPRLPVPRPRVPAGAVAIAGARTGVYPFASPGGWNLVGRVVDAVLFHPARGATLQPGDRVRFEAA